MSKIIKGIYDIHVGTYDWGAAVDYAILQLEEPLSDQKLLEKAVWKVTEHKQVTDLNSPERNLCEKDILREIECIYFCDQRGHRSFDDRDRLCVKLRVSPTEGSPLAFTSSREIFVWSDPYELQFSYEGEGYTLQIEKQYRKRKTSVDKFEKKSYTTSQGVQYDYAEYIPENDSRTLYVWLHGLGEGQFPGSDAYLPLVGRKGKSMSNAKFQNMIGGARVLVPQCPTYWMDADGKQTNFKDGMIHADGTSYYRESLEELIDDYAAKMQAKNIILAGCSNGGYMCMVLAMNRPDCYSAVVPICEAVPDAAISDAMIKRLCKVPLYFVYSKDDPVVLPELHEIPTIKRLQKAGAKNLHCSVSEQVIDRSGTYKGEEGPYRYNGHLSWIYYDNNETEDESGLSAWEWIAKNIHE